MPTYDEMKPHEQRVVDEGKEIGAIAGVIANTKQRAAGLANFIANSPVFTKLAADEQADMVAQLAGMSKLVEGYGEYTGSLQSRIARIG